MLREIDEALLAELEEAEIEERMQDEVDRALESEVCENWYGFTSEDSVSALSRTHPETYTSAMQRYGDATVSDGTHSGPLEAQYSAQIHSPNVDVGFTSRTSRPHPKILHTGKIGLAKSKRPPGTAKTKKVGFFALPGLKNRVRVRRRYLYEML
jgi:hypothetical protein